VKDWLKKQMTVAKEQLSFNMEREANSLYLVTHCGSCSS